MCAIQQSTASTFGTQWVITRQATEVIAAHSAPAPPASKRATCPRASGRGCGTYQCPEDHVERKSRPNRRYGHSSIPMSSQKSREPVGWEAASHQLRQGQVPSRKGPTLLLVPHRDDVRHKHGHGPARDERAWPTAVPVQANPFGTACIDHYLVAVPESAIVSRGNTGVRSRRERWSTHARPQRAGARDQPSNHCSSQYRACYANRGVWRHRKSIAASSASMFAARTGGLTIA